jgi:integrase
MPKLSTDKAPSYRHYKPRNLGCVTLGGVTHYLGPYKSKASLQEYDRVVSEWIAAGRPRGAVSVAGGEGLCVGELITRYMEHVATEHAGPNFKTTEGHFKAALRPVLALYGPTEASEFGPVALTTVRDQYVKGGWSRRYVNDQVWRVKDMFRWAVEKQLIPPARKHNVEALEYVKKLQKGRTAAAEPVKVLPVTDQHLDQVIECTSSVVGAMLRLQRLTGMRPGEVCAMRNGDIIRSETKGDPWTYRLRSHKTEKHGVSGDVYLGPVAQATILPFLGLDPESHLFKPSVAIAEIRGKRTQKREEEESNIGQGNSPGTNVVRRPRKRPGDFYTVASYRRAIAYACDQAFPLPEKLEARLLKRSRAGGTFESKASMEARMSDDQRAAAAEAEAWRKEHRFHPHQVRHAAATQIRAEHGMEVAQVLLRHKTLSATQIYAEKNVEAARKLAGKVG